MENNNDGYIAPKRSGFWGKLKKTLEWLSIGHYQTKLYDD